jgi:hypothetical protein
MLNIAPFRNALQGVRSESGERNAVQRVLDASGHRKLPTTERTTLDDGRSARVYLWRNVGATGCAVALIAGPEVVGDVRVLYPHTGGAKGSLYVPATGNSPALTDSKQARHNPAEGGASSLKALTATVKGHAGEQGQVNAVIRALASHGYAAADRPEVHSTTVDRATYRIYLWRDTPYGDHLVLSTGPSFEPALALASQIPADPGVGFYVKALVDKSPRTLAGASRVASRAMPKPTPAAEVATERVARKVRIPKAKVAEAAAAVAEAENAPTVTVAHVEAVEEAAGNGWTPSAGLTDAQVTAREIARARGRKLSQDAEADRIQAIADAAMTDARRVTLGDGGRTNKDGVNRAADIIAEARENIKRLISGKSPGRKHDLGLIDQNLMAQFRDLIATCERLESEKEQTIADRRAWRSAPGAHTERERVFDALVERGLPERGAGPSADALTAIIERTAPPVVKSAEVLLPSNKNSRAVFEQFTGEKLPKTIKETEAFVIRRLGGLPEEVRAEARAPKAAPAAPPVDAAAAAREMQEMIQAHRAMRGAS